MHNEETNSFGSYEVYNPQEDEFLKADLAEVEIINKS